jgi:hypothetical protein
MVPLPYIVHHTPALQSPSSSSSSSSSSASSSSSSSFFFQLIFSATQIFTLLHLVLVCKAYGRAGLALGMGGVLAFPFAFAGCGGLISIRLRM